MKQDSVLFARLTGNANRELLASLTAAGTENFASARRGHALEKTVYTLSLSSAWLIGPFHRWALMTQVG